MILPKGSRAPVSGVLVPDKNYRYYQAMTLERDMLSEKLNDPSFCMGNEQPPMWPIVLAFFVGASATYFLTTR